MAKFIDPNDYDALMEEYGKFTMFEIMKRLHIYTMREEELIARERQTVETCKVVEKSTQEMRCIIQAQLDAASLNDEDKTNEGWHQAWIVQKSLNLKMESDIKEMQRAAEALKNLTVDLTK